jgi:hypothetical protein
MQVFAIAVLLFASLGRPLPAPVLEDRVDLIEVHIALDAVANPYFVQVIFYDWSRQHRAFVVREWRRVEGAFLPATEEQQQEFKQRMDEYFARLSLNQQIRLRTEAERYVGEFIGGDAYPTKKGGQYVSFFFDSHQQCFRRVSAPSFRLSASQKDPERLNRRLVPESARKRLKQRSQYAP